MYSNYPIDKLVDDAKTAVFNNDRMLYKAYYEEIERYIIANNMLLGGVIALHTIIDKKLNKDSFVWDIYTDNVYEVSKKLVDILYNVYSPHIPNETIILRTDMRHKEFTIIINTRYIAKIYGFDKYRSISLSKFIDNVFYTSLLTAQPIGIINEELLIINVYRILYSPSRCDDWPTYIKYERLLFDKITDKARNIVYKQQYHKNDIDEIIDTLLEHISNSNSVIVGDYAMNYIDSNIKQDKLQFITFENIDILTDQLNKKINMLGSKYKIINIKYAQFLIDDLQFTKHTLYLVTPNDKQIILADIYNSISYELIPYYVHDKLYIGNFWVILRFAFIELWSLQIILGYKKKDTNSSIQNRYAKIINDLATFRKLDNKCDLFQLTNYIGITIGDNIYKKQLLESIGEKFPPYYPHKNIVKGSNMPLKIEAQLATSTINLEEYRDTKMKILKKITRHYNATNIIDAIIEFRDIASNFSMWGVGKTMEKFKFKNSHFLPFIPNNIHTCVDIGCGDGLDIIAIDNYYKVKSSICADINDNRDPKYINKSIFSKIEIGKPFSIDSNIADLVIVFHSIHHMQEDITYRLKEIVRIIKPGGILMVKDHNVTNRESAAAVDFEHFVYYASQTKGDIYDIMINFPKYEPMNYYSMDYINKLFVSMGMTNIFSKTIHELTYVYGLVYKKI